MKKVIFNLALSVLLLCGSNMTYGQGYHPVVTGNTCLWMVPRMDLAGCRIDTIQAVKGENNMYSLFLFNSAYGTQTMYGYLYASDDNEKLYFRGFEEDEDLLIMDLSLSVGDTFLSRGLYGEDMILIVDSVYYDYGLKHVEFVESTWDLTPQADLVKCCFIEGVGPNWGFSMKDDNAKLIICKHEDNELFYAFPDTTVFKDCGFREPCNGDAVVTHDKVNLNVYPNPFADKVWIESDNDISSIVVYDMFGQLLQVINQTASTNVYELYMESYPSGVYLVRCDIGKKNEYVKIVKK